MSDYLQSCKSCWWQEGGKCFQGEFERLPNGDSPKPADLICEHHKNKRSVLGPLLGDVELIIISEENAKAKGQL